MSHGPCVAACAAGAVQKAVVTASAVAAPAARVVRRARRSHGRKTIVELLCSWSYEDVPHYRKGRMPNPSGGPGGVSANIPGGTKPPPMGAWGAGSSAVRPSLSPVRKETSRDRRTVAVRHAHPSAVPPSRRRHCPPTGAVLLPAPLQPAPAAPAVGDHRDVADLAGHAVAAAHQPPADDEPAADPGADRDRGEVVVVAAGAEARLGPRRGVRVVLDDDGQVQLRRQRRAQVLVCAMRGSARTSPSSAARRRSRRPRSRRPPARGSRRARAPRRRCPRAPRRCSAPGSPGGCGPAACRFRRPPRPRSSCRRRRPRR